MEIEPYIRNRIIEYTMPILKLNDSDVEAIKEQLRQGASQVEIAEEYNIEPRYVSKLASKFKLRKKDLKPEQGQINVASVSKKVKTIVTAETVEAATKDTEEKLQVGRDSITNYSRLAEDRGFELSEFIDVAVTFYLENDEEISNLRFELETLHQENTYLQTAIDPFLQKAIALDSNEKLLLTQITMGQKPDPRLLEERGNILMQ